MSIAACLEKLVAAKRITQKAADSALALHEGIQGRLYPEMGPASADAAAALEAARTMAQAAKERKLAAAFQAIRQAEALQRMERHDKGKSAGLMGILVRDNWERGAQTGSALHVDAQSEIVTKRLLGFVDGSLKPYASRWAGLSQDTATVWNVARELYREDTGDAVAKAAAKGWSDAVTYAVDRVKRGGKRLSVLEDWRLPQFWDSARVGKVSEREFLDDLMTEYNAGNMRVMDKAGEGDAPRAAVPGIIQNAYKDINLARSEGGGGAMSNQMRVFRFDKADTYIRLMQKYGIGHGGLYNTMIGHLSTMGREISLVELLGPNYQANFDRLLKVAQEDDVGRTRSLGAKLQRSITLNSPASAKRTFDDMTGKLGTPQSELIAGIGGGMRNLQTAARLGSAAIAALPGDSMTAFLAANYNGVPAANVLARLVRDMTTNREGSEALAKQINLTASALIDNAIGTKRFADQIVGAGLTARIAETVIRVQGLQAWTEGLKRAFAMEFNGLVARQADHAFEKLDPVFRNFLTRYGFTPADWDKLRVTPQIEADGARFFDVNGVEDQRLADRLQAAIIDERGFAVIEPDSRIRSALAGGQQRGTILGEAIRSASQFKSFPMTFMMTHLMRAVTQGDIGNRAYRTTQLVLLTTFAGAVLSQMQALIAGRDPQDMASGRFWTSAFIRGGGGGMLGDFVYSTTTKGDQGIYEYAAGPGPGAIISLAGDVGQSLVNADVWTGEKSISGKTFAQHVKAWTPGSSLWFSKLATDRLIFDNIQAMIDPQYKQSFARQIKRQKKDFGQSFWWAPGQTLPERGPELP